MIYSGTSYGLAILGVSEERRENRGLLLKMQFLEKFIEKEVSDLSEMVAYEDKARLKYGMEPISGEVRKAGIGGLPSREDMMLSSMMDPVVMKAESIRFKCASLLRQAELQESTFKQTSNNIEKKHTHWTNRPSIWPTKGRITSKFGYRYHPFSGHRLLHEGIDIANKRWTPIYAPADGQVIDVNNRTHFGKMVKISHYNGVYKTLYAHLQKASVTEGQVVKRGELIGYIGNSGRSTGPHLHYEVHHEGRPVDPMGFILTSDQIVD
ncbi:MAG: M23 family metallopeptidase [Chitinispirillaceae bacterium]